MNEFETPQYGLDGELIEPETTSPSVEKKEEGKTSGDKGEFDWDKHRDKIEDGSFDWDKHREQLSSEDISLEDITKQITEFTGITTQLRNLEYTVSKEGVSKEDIRTLKSIQYTLSEQGVDFTGVALEDYTHGFFTDERSSVSLSIAQENFLGTMMRTVKEWIKKLIAFLGRMIDWAVSNILGEDMYGRKLSRGVNAWQRAKDVRVKAEILANTKRVTEREMDAYALSLLRSDRLTLNFVTLAAFGSVKAAKKIDTHAKDAMTGVSAVTKSIDNLKKDLENSSGAISVGNAATLKISMLANDFDDFIEPDRTRSSLADVLKPEVFERNILKETKTVTPYEDIVKEYNEMRKKFKSINNIRNEKGIAGLVDYMNDINKSIVDMSKIINVIKQINDVKLQVVGLYVNYENHYINKIIEHVKNEVGSEGKLERIIRMVGEVRESIMNAT